MANPDDTQEPANTALEGREAQFRTLVENIPCVVYRRTLGDSWSIRYLSDGAESLLGYPAAEFVDDRVRSFDSVIHEDDRALVRALVSEAAGQGRHHQIEYRVRHPDAGIRWLEDRGRAARDDAGTVLHLDGFIVDVTARKTADTELRALNETLERRLQARDGELAVVNDELKDTIHILSHDLRAPLRHIKAFSQILQQDLEATGEAARHLEKLGEKADRMTDMLDRLLLLGRLGETEIRLTEVDSNAVVRTIIEQQRRERPKVDWQLRELPQVTADLTLFTQVFENLLSNAAKFSEQADSPCVVVQAEQSASETTFRVQDNGAGFDMGQRAKLFAPFQRLHPQSQFKGSGMGLSLVRKIVMRHGGRVWAEGAVGQGATFWFSLPLPQSPAP